MRDVQSRLAKQGTIGAATSSQLSFSEYIDQLRATKQVLARAAKRLSRKSRIRFAAGFAVTAIAYYWIELQRDERRAWPLPQQFSDVGDLSVDDRARYLAKVLGQTAAKVDPVTAGYFVGTAYAAALPDELRAQLGVYYTPPALVSRLLDQATAAGIDWTSASVLDPACGGGAFLAPVAERMLKALSHLEPHPLIDSVAARLRGFEIDPIAAWMSQVFLEATLLPLCRASGRRLPVLVEVCNSLVRDIEDQSFDLVIGNPPYGKIRLSPRMRNRYRDSLYGHANLYGLFTELALRRVKPGGVLAYVTPTSFLAGEYFKNLRAMLSRLVSPFSIDFVAERKGVFDEVLQETLLATYRRTTVNGSAATLARASSAFVVPVDENILRITSAGSFAVPDNSGSPWLVPRDFAQAGLLGRLSEMRHRLADWGYAVSTGPLVWNRHKDQLRKSNGAGCLPLVWAESVRPDGRFSFRAAKHNHRPYFKLRPGDGWLVVKESCVLVQRTTAKEQPKRLVAAVLPKGFVRKYGGAVIENHLNMVRPTKSSPAVAPSTLAAFLNSSIADQGFRCLSGSVAVSAYELEALPLPSPDRLTELAAALREEAPRHILDRICAAFYGVSAGL